MISQIKYALSSLKKNGLYTAINLGGLTLGLSVAIALTMTIIGFIGIDQFHENKNTVFKLITSDDSTTNSYYDASSALLAPAVKEALPEVIDYCQFLWANDMILGSPEHHVKENGFFVDEGWFRMLSFPLVYGNPDRVLAKFDNIVLSQKLSRKLFGDVNPIGSVVNLYSYDSESPDAFTVSGVFEDVPGYSSLQFEFAIPFAHYINRNSWVQSWGNIGTRSYVQVEPNTCPVQLSHKITALARELNRGMEEKQVYGLAPIYKSNGFIYKLSGEPTFGFYIIIALAIVGLSLLLISIINYVNLSVATAIKRSKEIGVKKIHGASRMDLAIQFFTEAFIVVTLATMLATLGHHYLLNIMLPSPQPFSLFINPMLVRVLGGIMLFTILVTTWYPALYMSKFSPLTIQRNAQGGGSRLSFSRRFLVTLQFFAAILLITTSVILTQQVDFIFNRSMGMDTQNTVFFTQNKQLQQRREAFAQELDRLPGIEGVTFANQLPCEVVNSTRSVEWEGKDPLEKDWYAYINAGDNFLTTMQIELEDGADFTQSTSSMVIVNRAAASRMGMENPVGNIISLNGTDCMIVGVVKNFSSQLISYPNTPLFIRYAPNSTSLVLVRLTEGNQNEGLKSLATVFSQFSPDFILDYTFIEHDFNQKYRTIKQMRSVMVIASFLAIVIACLGLLGLTVHSSERRVKELGVRKINGARIYDLIRLLSGQMVGTILIAAAFALPLAFILNMAILQNMPDSINLSVFHFIWSLVILFGVTGLIVGWQIVRAARRNPVEALRYE